MGTVPSKLFKRTEGQTGVSIFPNLSNRRQFVPLLSLLAAVLTGLMFCNVDSKNQSVTRTSCMLFQLILMGLYSARASPCVCSLSGT